MTALLRARWTFSRALAALFLVAAFAVTGPSGAAPDMVIDLTAPKPPWGTDPNTVLNSTPAVADLTGDGVPEIVAATRNGWLYALDRNLAILPGWPKQLNAHIGSSPAIGDLDADSVPEIVIGVGEATDIAIGRQGEGGIAAYRPDGSLKWFYETPPFPETGETQIFSTPAIGDLDGDGFNDVVVASFNRFIYAVNRNGQNLAGWPIEVVDTTWSSPALVDLNHDGRLSVVIGSDFGWQGTPNLGCVSPPTNGLLFLIEADARIRRIWCMQTPIWSSPAVVDLLGDGTPVAIFGTNNFSILCGSCSKVGQDFVYAIKLTDGTPPPGWPVKLSHGPEEAAMSSPAVGDVDGDGTKEIAIGSAWGAGGSKGSVYLINANGTMRWERQFIFDTLGSPVLGDIDGDSKADVVVGNGDWNVHAFNGAGASLGPGGNEYFHTDSFVKSSPVLTDLDGDGLNEMVVASGFQNGPPKLWVKGTSGRSQAAANPWPTFRQNQARTGTNIPPVIVAPRYNFDEFLVLSNPGSQNANATISLQVPAGAPTNVPIQVPANGRATFPVDSVLSNSEVSARVDSDRPLAAERAMYFSYGPLGWDGGHATHGALAPATNWFLAEGYTAPNFDTYVLIQNPGVADVVATVTLMKPGGENRDVAIPVPAQARRTLTVKTVPGFEFSEVSFRISATGPVVVERSMYFDYDGRTGGHDAVGVTELSTSWFLAEGYTAEAFDTYVLVANPNDSAANVTYTFLRPTGEPVVTGRVIPPRSRGTVKVDDVPGLAASEVSTRVTADVPIAVERAVYFDFRGRTGGHDAEGVTALATEWYLAEGATIPGFDTFILLANPSDGDAQVTLTYYKNDSSVQNQGIVVPARSRRTVYVNEVVPGTGVSTRVTSTNGVGISVERAMYFLYAGIWDGGHDAQAVSSLSTTWYFAEGYTGA